MVEGVKCTVFEDEWSPDAEQRRAVRRECKTCVRSVLLKHAGRNGFSENVTGGGEDLNIQGEIFIGADTCVVALCVPAFALQSQSHTNTNTKM